MTPIITSQEIDLKQNDVQKLSTTEIRQLIKLAKSLAKWKNNLPEVVNIEQSILIPEWSLSNNRYSEWQDAIWQWHFWNAIDTRHPLGWEVIHFRKNLFIGLFGEPVVPSIPMDSPFNYLTHYDLFLRYYSSETQKSSSTYYTPPPLARFLVKKVLQLLTDNLQVLPEKVVWVDFACGTGLFPQLILEATHFNKEVEIHAYENFLAPYGLAKYHFRDYSNVKIHLANPLDPQNEDMQLWESWKNKILIVIGNPPWSGISKHKNTWILNKIEDYKQINGISLKEKKYWLQDDYVKFMRLGQYWLDNVDSGIMALITNHNYLDNPTFRGMRYSLMQSFDKALVYDLKGNLKKNNHDAEKADENVFGIETGVAASFWVKNVRNDQDFNKNDNIEFCSISGTKDQKLRSLGEDSEVESVMVTPTMPYFFLTPQTLTDHKKYDSFIPIRDLFRTSNIGIVTARDKFLISFEPEVILERLRIASNEDLSDTDFANHFHLKNTSSFSIQKARKSLFETNEPIWHKFFTKIAYRPLDFRWIFFHPDWVERRVFGTSQHLLQPNIGMVFQRGCSSHHTINLPQATRNIIDHGFSYPANRAVSYLAPLYFYEGSSPTSNLRIDLLEVFAGKLGFELQYEKFYNYIFSVLHSDFYKEKYASPLTMDFPRIPLPPDEETFQILSDTGKELIRVHLLEFSNFELPEITLNSPSIIIEQVKWQNQCLYLSKNHFIKGISMDEFLYSLGGYEALKKYLNSHKKRLLVDSILDQIRKGVALIRTLPSLIERVNRLTESWI